MEIKECYYWWFTYQKSQANKINLNDYKVFSNQLNENVLGVENLFFKKGKRGLFSVGTETT